MEIKGKENLYKVFSCLDINGKFEGKKIKLFKNVLSPSFLHIYLRNIFIIFHLHFSQYPNIRKSFFFAFVFPLLSTFQEPRITQVIFFRYFVALGLLLFLCFNNNYNYFPFISTIMNSIITIVRLRGDRCYSLLIKTSISEFENSIKNSLLTGSRNSLESTKLSMPNSCYSLKKINKFWKMTPLVIASLFLHTQCVKLYSRQNTCCVKWYQAENLDQGHVLAEMQLQFEQFCKLGFYANL